MVDVPAKQQSEEERIAEASKDLEANGAVTFSLILPSRGRPELLDRCIRSFYNKARFPKLIEIFVMLDDDAEDPYLQMFSELPSEISDQIIRVVRKRGNNLSNHYYNFAAKAAHGKLLWSLNDECECLSEDWDVKLINYAAPILTQCTDNVLYLATDDSTHTKSRLNLLLGSCFPIISRDTVKALGVFFPPQLEWQGIDVALWKIFTRLAENHRTERRIICSDIKVSHNSSNNQNAEPDETHMRSAEITKRAELTVEEIEYFCFKVLKYIFSLNADIITKLL